MTKTGPAQLTAHRRSLNALTGIRLCAAVYVIVYHSKLSPELAGHGHWLIANFLDNGYEAVAVFFLLSGFILAYTYSGQITGWPSYRRFWEARFARIWPVYAVSLLLISAVERFLPKPLYMAAALSMVQAWDPFHFGLAGVWNFVCWTLSCEAFFYLVFPFFHLRIGRLDERFLLLLLCGLLCVIAALNLTRNVVGYMTGTFFVLWMPLAVQRLPEFLAGVTLGNYFSRMAARATHRETTQALVPGGWLTYTGAVLGVALLCHAPWRWSSLVVIPVTLLLLGLASEKTLVSRLLSTPWMMFGGGISYSLYLTQIPAKDISTWVAGHLKIHSMAELSAIMFVVLLLMSSALFLGVEQPARNAIRSFFAGRERRHAQ